MLHDTEMTSEITTNCLVFYLIIKKYLIQSIYLSVAVVSLTESTPQQSKFTGQAS